MNLTSLGTPHWLESSIVHLVKELPAREREKIEQEFAKNPELKVDLESDESLFRRRQAARSLFIQVLGWPIWFTDWVELLFEGSPVAESVELLLKAIKAVSAGINLTHIDIQFQIYLLECGAFDPVAFPQVQKELERASSLLHRRLRGDEPLPAEWEAAKAAASSMKCAMDDTVKTAWDTVSGAWDTALEAALQARDVAEAVESGVWFARHGARSEMAAREAGDTALAKSAWYAAWYARNGMSSAIAVRKEDARRAKCSQMANKLLELMAEAT